MNDSILVFTAASHYDVLALVTQVAVLLFMARTMGEISLRLGQPAVVGELLAGIILGPSFLGNIFPFLHGTVIPTNAVQGYLLEAVALLGAIFLLLITGLETDLKLIGRHARTAFGVALGGLLLPLIAGYTLGQNLPDSLLIDPSKRLIFSLFIATAMSISAIPVIAKILLELKLIRRNIGQTIIAAGMIDDTTGWVLLSIVAGLAAGQVVTAGSILITVIKVFGFLIFSFTVGRWLVRRTLNFVQDFVTSRESILTHVVILTFTWASLTQSLRLEPVLGAFVMGILFGHMPRLHESVRHKLESIAIGIFAPIFFAVAGLKVNVLNLLTPSLMLISAVVILVAIACKVIGVYLGARLIGRCDHWTALSFGVALNARGAMEIIVATIGLSLGILSQEMFSVIVLMAMTTSLMAPAALRWTLSHVHFSEEEEQRLRREDLMRDSPVGAIRRVLLPLRRWDSAHQPSVMQVIKSRLLQRIGTKSDLNVTLCSVDKAGFKESNVKFLDQFSLLLKNVKVSRRVIESDDVVNVVLDESAKGYDLLVLGASQSPQQDAEYIFSRMIDSLVRLSPCISMVVHAKHIRPDWVPQRILVPADGSLVAKHTVEFSFLLASAGDHMQILHIVEKDVRDWHEDMRDEILRRQIRNAERMLKELQEQGPTHGITPQIEIKIGQSPETVILEAARQEQFDLIVLGTDVRVASDRLFLGPRVERILRDAPCPVIVLNFP